MYYIVVNPNSDRGRTMFFLPALTALFDEAGIPYETHITTGPLNGYENTLKFCQSRDDLQGVIAIGGDGIVQEIVMGMAEAFITPEKSKIPVPLGILPSVTGSDFISTLEGSKYMAIAKYGKNNDIKEVSRGLFEAVTDRRFRTIDMVSAGGRAFLNNGYIGLAANVAKDGIETERKFSDKTYFTIVYKNIVRHKNIKLCVETETNQYEGEYTMLIVANGQYYGSGIRICPDATLDSGKLTLCMVRGLSRIKAAMLFPSLLLGRHGKLKAFSFTECERVKITLPPEVNIFCVDGNIFPCEGELEFKILPGALNIFL